MGPDPWDQAHNPWPPDSWPLIPGVWHMGPRIWRLTPGIWHLTPETWDMKPSTCAPDTCVSKVCRPLQRKIVGHLPIEISRITPFNIARGTILEAQLTPAHYRRSPLVQRGLETPCSLTSRCQRLKKLWIVEEVSWTFWIQIHGSSGNHYSRDFQQKRFSSYDI